MEKEKEDVINHFLRTPLLSPFNSPPVQVMLTQQDIAHIPNKDNTVFY